MSELGSAARRLTLPQSAGKGIRQSAGGFVRRFRAVSGAARHRPAVAFCRTAPESARSGHAAGPRHFWRSACG
eukprot:10323907-Alexandrium_andersonii.AAC.1